MLIAIAVVADSIRLLLAIAVVVGNKPILAPAGFDTAAGIAGHTAINSPDLVRILVHIPVPPDLDIVVDLHTDLLKDNALVFVAPGGTFALVHTVAVDSRHVDAGTLRTTGAHVAVCTPPQSAAPLPFVHNIAAALRLLPLHTPLLPRGAAGPRDLGSRQFQFFHALAAPFPHKQAHRFGRLFFVHGLVCHR